MEQILEFLKEAGRFFLATTEDGQPKVRPMNNFAEINGKLYILTNCDTGKCTQLANDSNVAVTAFTADKRWLRMEGELIRETSNEPRDIMLKNLSEEGEDIIEADRAVAYYFKDVTAGIKSLKEKTIKINF